MYRALLLAYLLLLTLQICAAQPKIFLSSSASDGSQSNRYAIHPKKKWIIDSTGSEQSSIDFCPSSAVLMTTEKQSGSSGSEPLDLSVQSTQSSVTEQLHSLHPVQQRSPSAASSNFEVEFPNSTSKRNDVGKCRKFKCSDCCETLASAHSLKFHYVRFHGNGTLHECDICNKKFPHLCNLKVHMRVHTGERPYSCQHCNRSFSQSGNLKLHLLVHSGEKPFECDVCHWKFSQANNCRRHYQAKHSSAKPFACNWCNETYAVKKNLKSHQKKCKIANITVSENEFQTYL